MTATARLLQIARRIIEEAGRPLSVRRILRAGQESAAFEGDGPDLDALKAALDAGVTEGAVVQMRRGVFSVAPPAAAEAAEAAEPEAPAEAAPAAPEPAEAEADADSEAEDEPEGGRRRRRRRRGRSPERPVAPTSLEETAELSAGAPDRDALKGKMWARLKARAAEVTDQSAAPADEGGAQAEDEQPRRRRERGPRREKDDEKPRRRRRRRSEEPAAAAPEAASAPTETPAEAPAEGGSPRDALKAKLARRRRPSKSADSAPVEAPAPTTAPAEPTAEAPAPADEPRRGGRDRLKARLAARARGGADAQEPAETPETVTAEAPAVPASPEPASAASDDGDPRSRLKARLARRGRGESAPRAPAEPKPAPARSEKGVDPRSRLKARLAARTAGQDAAETPAAAAAPAPAEAKAPAKPARSESGERLTGRAALKARLAARASRPAATPAEPTVEAPAPKAEAKDAGSTSNARAALKNRLARRRGNDDAPAKTPIEPVVEAAPAAEKAPRGRGSARDALKSRLAARRGPSAEAVEPAAAPAAPAVAKADPLDVPLAPTRRPYKERRRREKAPPRERRSPSLPEIKANSALVSAALDALRSAGGPMALDDLVGAVSEAGGSHGLRAALLAENARCARVGLRAPFVLHYGGLIGLTEWGLSDRYRALEAQIQEALAEQRELMRRDLLSRIGDLDDGPFEQVVALLLERLGHFGARVVHRQAGTVAMTVQRAVGDSTETIAVIARRSWSPIKDGTVRRLRDMLGAFGADAGLLMTVGTFATSARSEALAEGSAPIRLIDGAGLAGLLHDHGIGLTTHQPVIRHVDSAFFESLGT